MTAKEYIQQLGIEDETIYDNAERMHSLECLLDDYHQSQLKLLAIYNVSQKRELLIDCVDYCCYLDNYKFRTTEDKVDNYIKSINCG